MRFFKNGCNGGNKIFLHSCQCVANPLFSEDHPILPTPLFRILSNTHTHTHTHTSLSPPTPHHHCNFCCPVFQLSGWSCHIWCAIYIYTWIIWIYTCWALNLSIRRTLMCVLCHKASSLLRPDTLWFFTGTLIWYHTHRNSTIRGQPPVMCS